MGADKNIAQAQVLVAVNMAPIVAAADIYTPPTSGAGTITIEGVTFDSSFDTTATQTVTNIKALIAANAAITALYTVTGTTTLIITSKRTGVLGNGYAVSETGNGSWATPTVTGGTGALAATLTSRAMRTALLDDYSFQGVWTGSAPVGTLDVQVSNSHQENGGVVTNEGTWTSLYTVVPPVTGNTGSLFLNIAAVSAAFVRCVYTPTSGSGTLDVYFNGRSI